MAQGFDPTAATNAYLATLSPEAHAKATAYTQGGHWVLLGAAIVSVLVSWIVIRTGVLVKVRGGVEAKRPHPWLAVFAVVAVDSILEGLLSIPWDAYAHWWREKSYGMTSRAFGGWLSEHFLSMAVGTVQALIVFALFYWVVRRLPKTWWIWSAAGVIVVILGFFILNLFFVEPLFNTYKPAPPGQVRDTVVAMAKQVGVPSDKVLIYDGSKQSNRYTANAGGFLGLGRIAMSDVMFKKDADLAEVKGVVGHEMGHYVHGHVPLTAVVFGLMALIGFFLVDRLFPLAARLLGAHGVTGLADPAGLPVVSVIFTVLSLLATPLTNTYSRWQEADADHFSVVHFNEPDGLAKALVKTIEYRADSPSGIEEFIFYDHPSVRARVQAMMDWKAAHPKPDAVSDGPAPAPAAAPTVAPTEAPR
ncbi:M48 family metalloprotease [Phenylobacterium sp.]|uniref:M48 family metalloprotease n=1 Tax=Phenylobacterium sp. TaxID=1871053 RepID=UPI0012258827|nr:M48 family metalloprotease [Phenylobacterium sp.]THD58063.1 MAG: M48 family peptidase [Phenylobacterium sp.]